MVHDNVNDNPLELGEKHHFMEVIQYIYGLHGGDKLKIHITQAPGLDPAIRAWDSRHPAQQITGCGSPNRYQLLSRKHRNDDLPSGNGIYSDLMGY